MAQVYDKPITDATNWGGDATTGGLKVKKSRVQEYIKNKFNEFSSKTATLEKITAKSLTDLNARVEKLEPVDLTPWFSSSDVSKESNIPSGNYFLMQDGAVQPVHVTVTISKNGAGDNVPVVLFCAGVHGETTAEGGTTYLDSLILKAEFADDGTFKPLDVLSAVLSPEGQLLDPYVHPLAAPYQIIISDLLKRVSALEQQLQAQS